MSKRISIVICLILLTIISKAEDGLKITSRVQKVVVFLNGAQVNRTATVNISSGTSTLIFSGISPNIDPQSIQVHGNGEFIILSVKHELDFLNEQAKQKHVDDLRTQQKAIRDKISLQNSLFSVYKEEENMLVKNQVVSGQNTTLDIVKLKQALDFQTERLTELKKKQLDINAQLVSLNEELEKYNKQIADINQGQTTATNDILVTVSSKTSFQSEFRLSYVVHNAGWYPTYDIRAKDVNSPISISYKANVSQKCGEDWRNIKLTLSTGNPSVSGSEPELNPYYLNFGMIYSTQAANITSVSGRVIAREDGLPIPGVTVKVKGTSIGTQTNTDGVFTLQVPSGNRTLVYSFVGYQTQERVITSPVINVALVASTNQLGEVVVTTALGVKHPEKELNFSTLSSKPTDLLESKTTPLVINTENQTNVEFNITDPYSLPSDGKQYTVDIKQLDVNASYEYAVTPKLSTDAFLTAKLTDWNKYDFLSGEANLFFEGTFIGKSLLNTDGTTDTLNVSLGADKNIVVTRTSLKSLSEKQSLGSNKKETRDWQIEVKNRKNQSINLLVEDQVPVSQNSSIEVETQELSGGELDKATGKVLWILPLKAQDDKKLQLKYQVKYPKNQSVIIQ
jgi:Domain of unknown function (DUF4139)/N-terminal domain of unknown function (DUF4140)